MVSETPRMNHNVVPPRRRAPKPGYILLPTLFYVVLMLAACSVIFYFIDEGTYGVFW